jgi:O-antigen/teichoic acid export membrane protein
MFGIMALAHVLISGLSLFSDLGLRQNIVQHRRGDDPTFLNTVWTVQIIRGGITGLMTLVLAVIIFYLDQIHWWPKTSVYANPLLPRIVGVLAFAVVIGGFQSTKFATASRTLALQRPALIAVMSQLAGLLCMLAWAMFDRSVWALVAGWLVSTSLSVALSHAAMPGNRNRLRWDRQAAREIIDFGKWVFLSSILSFLAASGDRLVLGNFTDSTTFGFYSIAFLLISAIQTVFLRLINNVAFPAVSEVIRQRREVLKDVYYRFRALLDAIAFMTAGVLFASGHLVVHILYDDRYLPAGPMLAVLSVSLVALPYQLAMSCFLALGVPGLLIPAQIAQLLAVLVGVPIAFSEFGLTGALWVIALSRIVTVPITAYLKDRFGLFDWKRELRFLPLCGVGYLVGWSLELAVTSPH